MAAELHVVAAAVDDVGPGDVAQRRAVELTEGRSRIEACIDLGEIRAGGRSTPVREIELELLHGEVGDLFTLARRLMADAPLGFQLHALVAFGLFALWPFTRLVHVFSAPVGYLTRPYIVYRSRDPKQLGSQPSRRGWERVG